MEPLETPDDRDLFLESRQPFSSLLPELWRSNHGTLLVVFALVVTLVGAELVSFRQIRLKRPSFPKDKTFRDIERLQQSGLMGGGDQGGETIQESVDEPLSDSQTSQDAVEPSVTQPGDTVSFRISNLQDSESPVLIAVYANAASFNRVASALVRESVAPADPESVQWQIARDRLPDPLAVAAFQDSDGDGQLTRGAFGAPVERYGFSNNARAIFRPPDFEAAVIPRPQVGAVIEISLR